MGLHALLAEIADGGWFRVLHGESGFDGLESGGIHDARAGVVFEEPGLSLVDGCAVDDGDCEEIVAVIHVGDLHDLSGSGDG